MCQRIVIVTIIAWSSARTWVLGTISVSIKIGHTACEPLFFCRAGKGHGICIITVSIAGSEAIAINIVLILSCIGIITIGSGKYRTRSSSSSVTSW